MFVQNQLELDFPSCSQVKNVVFIQKSNALFYFKSGDYHLIDLYTLKKLVSGKLPSNILEIQHFYDCYVAYFTNNGKLNLFDVFHDPNNPIFKYNLPTAVTSSAIPEGNTRAAKAILGQTFIYNNKTEKQLFVLERIVGIGPQVKNVITVFNPLANEEPSTTFIQSHKFPLNLSFLSLSKKIFLWDQYAFDYETLRGPKKNLNPVPQFFTGDNDQAFLQQVEILGFDFEEKQDSVIVGASEVNEINQVLILENTTNSPKMRLICLEKKIMLRTILFPYDSHGICITNYFGIQNLKSINKKLIIIETESSHSELATYSFGLKNYLTCLNWSIRKNDTSFFNYSDCGDLAIEIPNHKVVEENSYKGMNLKVNHHRLIRKKLISLHYLLKLLGTYHIYTVKMCYEMLP